MGVFQHVIQHKRWACASQRALGWGPADLARVGGGQAGPGVGRGSARPRRQRNRLGCGCIPSAGDAAFLLGLALQHDRATFTRLPIKGRLVSHVCRRATLLECRSQNSWVLQCLHRAPTIIDRQDMDSLCKAHQMAPDVEDNEKTLYRVLRQLYSEHMGGYAGHQPQRPEEELIAWGPDHDPPLQLPPSAWSGVQRTASPP